MAARDAKLASGTALDHSLVSSGGVGDQGWHGQILTGRTLAERVGVTEAPGVESARVGSDGDRVVGAAGQVRKGRQGLGLEEGVLCVCDGLRSRYGARSAVLVAVDGIWERADADLVHVEAAAAEQGAVVEQEEGVVLAGGDHLDGAVEEDALRGGDEGAVGDGGAHAALAVLVEPPGEQALFLGEGETVVFAAEHGADAPEAHGPRVQRLEPVAVEHLAAQLVLLAVPPRVDAAVSVQEHEVVLAGGDLDDLGPGERGHAPRRALHLDLVPVEPEHALVAPERAPSVDLAAGEEHGAQIVCCRQLRDVVARSERGEQLAIQLRGRRLQLVQVAVVVLVFIAASGVHVFQLLGRLRRVPTQGPAVIAPPGPDVVIGIQHQRVHSSNCNGDDLLFVRQVTVQPRTFDFLVLREWAHAELAH